MAGRLCPDPLRASLAIVAATAVLVCGVACTAVAMLAAGMILGIACLRETAPAAETTNGERDL